MTTTPVFNIPYAGLNDPPHGPNQEKGLADACEAMGVGLDARLDQVEANGGLGGWVDTVDVTANSSTWNSSTEVRVLTSNSVALVNAAKYLITCDFSVLLGASAAHLGFRIRVKQGGTPTNADTLVVARGGRFDVATGVFMCQVKGLFTAPSSNPFTFAMFGCNPSGDTSVCNLYGSSSGAGNGLNTNSISIYRVKG